MFENYGARLALRATFAALLAGLAATSAALTDGAVSGIEVVTIASATVTAAGAWLGFGAATPAEPSFGKTTEG